MIAVTGAFMVLSRLPGLSAGASFSFASFVRTNTNRAGCVFMVVGPHFISSWIDLNCSSVTGPENPLCVRAVRNSTSSACASSILFSIRESGEW